MLVSNQLKTMLKSCGSLWPQSLEGSLVEENGDGLDLFPALRVHPIQGLQVEALPVLLVLGQVAPELLQVNVHPLHVLALLTKLPQVLGQFQLGLKDESNSIRQFNSLNPDIISMLVSVAPETQ